jgi:O-antigen/teichoic acid export membrane protein
VYWLTAEAYYVIVGKVVNATAVAGFRSVQNLSMLFPNFATAMSVLVLPRLSVRFAEAGGKAIRRPVLMFTVASALGAIVYAGSILLVGAPLLSTVYGNGYIEYVGLFPLLCLNLVLITISQGVQVGLRAMNAPREVFFGFLIAGLFTCTAGIAMTYRWQLNGAVAGLCCSTLLFLLFVTYRYQFLVRHRAVAARTHP